MDRSYARLRDDLDRSATAAGAALDRARRRAAWPRALEEAAWAALATAAILFVYRATTGGGRALALALVVVAVFAAWTAWRVVVARLVRTSRASALRHADEAVGAAERLVAADEFLGRAAPTPFMAAAIEDAAPHAARARDAAFAADRAAPPVAASAWGALAVAALLLAAATLLPHAAPSPRRARNAPDGPAAVADAGPREKTDADKPRAPTPPRPATTDAPLVPDASPEGSADQDAGDESEPTKGTDAMSRSGKSAQGGAPTRAADARGAPSDMAQTTEPTTRKPVTKKPRKKKAEGVPKPRKKSDPKKNAGATTGRGASSSSSRNPTSSTWTTKDRVPDAQEEVASNDEDVEDEDDEQEARGGIQPNLRDRKPPVNRDLSIGFGSRPSPDANGRGGPSQRKKSRGTASLVLGVPIPDHIKGQPNPGMTKVTQERVEPKAERADPRDAESRAPREDPTGHVARPGLAPWLKRLLREYFLPNKEGTEEK